MKMNHYLEYHVIWNLSRAMARKSSFHIVWIGSFDSVQSSIDTRKTGCHLEMGIGIETADGVGNARRADTPAG